MLLLCIQGERAEGGDLALEGVCVCVFYMHTLLPFRRTHFGICGAAAA